MDILNNFLRPSKGLIKWVFKNFQRPNEVVVAATSIVDFLSIFKEFQAMVFQGFFFINFNSGFKKITDLNRFFNNF